MIIVKKPKIRFKGFTETWEQRKLGDIVDRVTRRNTGLISNLPLTISAQYGLIDQNVFFDRRVASKDISGYYLINNGEFAYNKSTSVDAPWGAIKRLNRYENGVLSTLYIVFKIKNNNDVNSDFLVSYYDTNIWHKGISEIATEGARNHGLLNISPNDFFLTRLFIPCMIKEQEQIGSLFSKLDNLITLHQRKCENLKKLKKFMLQKMFPQNGENVPKVRFLNYTDTWEQRKLGEVFNERTERAKGNEELLSVTINNGVIRQIDSDKRNIASEDKSNYKIVQIGDVPYNSMRMWQGAVGNSEYNGIVSPAYTVLVPSTNADSKFFVELFKKNSTLNIFQRWSQGLTSDTWNLKYPILSKIEFYMPMIDEQKKIGSLFSKLDNLITLHQSKCDKLKEVKKYMLQNMFI